jgi:multimeric flavodoxin WrbA
MTNDHIIIFGSSRSKGNTWEAIQEAIAFSSLKNIPVINLNDLNISQYNYNHSNKDDDFIPVIEKIISYKHIILATPIYWYTMSAIMKIFIDRFTDLLTIRKDLGRKMRGVKLSIITSYSVYPEGKRGFEEIFKYFAEYMGISYNKCLFYYSGDNKEISMNNYFLVKDFVTSL